MENELKPFDPCNPKEFEAARKRVAEFHHNFSPYSDSDIEALRMGREEMKKIEVPMSNVERICRGREVED